MLSLSSCRAWWAGSAVPLRCSSANRMWFSLYEAGVWHKELWICLACTAGSSQYRRDSGWSLPSHPYSNPAPELWNQPHMRWEGLVLLLRLWHDIFSKHDKQCNMVKEMQNLVWPGCIHIEASGGPVPHRIVERNNHICISNVCVQVVPGQNPSLGEGTELNFQLCSLLSYVLITCGSLPNCYVPRKLVLCNWRGSDPLLCETFCVSLSPESQLGVSLPSASSTSFLFVFFNTDCNYLFPHLFPPTDWTPGGQSQCCTE